MKVEKRRRLLWWLLSLRSNRQRIKLRPLPLLHFFLPNNTHPLSHSHLLCTLLADFLTFRLNLAQLLTLLSCGWSCVRCGLCDIKSLLGIGLKSSLNARVCVCPCAGCLRLRWGTSAGTLVPRTSRRSGNCRQPSEISNSVWKILQYVGKKFLLHFL